MEEKGNILLYQTEDGEIKRYPMILFGLD